MESKQVKIWRSKINKGRSAFTNSWKGTTINTLKSAGLIVAHQAISRKDTQLLMLTGFCCKWLPQNSNKHPEVISNQISGGYEMYSVRREKFESRIRTVVGAEYRLGPVLSFLHSPIDHTTTHQAIHADSVSGDSYHGLVVLSDDCAPTIFEMRQSLHDPITGMVTISNATGELISADTRQKLERNFGCMLGPIATLEENMYPVSTKPLKAGTVILFRADMIHRGPPSTVNENRELLFFTLHNRPCRPSDDQIPAAFLGELLYGRGTRQQFELMARHEESSILVQPKLREHLTNEERRKYDKWFKAQCSDKNI
ncbi:hypothetical protein HDV02_005933 [Globomyces sp. JEL0801]|nr:hypothetical protein HDV02_005933 [Globomyces sp. JEL0801]